MESGHLMELRERQHFVKPSISLKENQNNKPVREQERETIISKINDGNTKLQLKTRKKKRKKETLIIRKKLMNKKVHIN